MRNKMELLNNCIAEGINCIFAFALMAVVLFDFLQVWPGTLFLLPLILVPVLLYLIREFVQNAVLFFAAHFLVWILATFFLSDVTSLKVMFGLAATVFVGVSIYRRLNSEQRGLGAIHPVVMTLAIFVLYLVDIYKGGGKAGGYLIQLMLIYLVTYLLYYYLQKFLQFINMNCKMTKNVPVRRIFSTSFGLVAVFILLMSVIVFLSMNKELIDYLAAMLGEGLLALISTFMRFSVPDVDAPSEQTELRRKEKLELGEMVPENDLLTLILNYIAFALGTILVIALVIMVIIGFYKLVRQAFRVSKGKDTLQNEFFEEKVESLKKEKKKKQEIKKKPVFAGTPEMQVRKQYYKAMSNKKAAIKIAGIRTFLAGTARENTVKYLEVADRKKEAVETFYTTYEKARYGQEPCNREDVRQMKQSRDILLKN